MRISTFLFYVLPLLLLPIITGWFIYQKGGTDLMFAHWPQNVSLYLIACAATFACYKLDRLITTKPKRTSGIRRQD